jgi:UDPglucose--hexose-1-phosphate uridylyltransferase
VPFHFQVVPRRSTARFSDDGPLGARLLHGSLTRLGAALGELPPLNLWVRTAPRDTERFCWRIEVMPRLAQLAGLEIGTGVHLNVLAPEDAAQRLRDVSL